MYFRRAGQLYNNYVSFLGSIKLVSSSGPLPAFQCFSVQYQKAGNGPGDRCKVYLITHCFSELRELVKMHGTHEKSNEEPLSYDEVLIVKVRITKKSVDWSSQIFLCTECIGDER